MDIQVQHYAFALFITGLICLIAILFKILFSGAKRQHKLLEEKEAELLGLYHTVEELVEQFSDQMNEAMEEIKELENRAIARVVQYTPSAPAGTPSVIVPEHMKHEFSEAPQRAETPDSSRIRAANEVLARAERMVKKDARKKPLPVTAVTPEKGSVFQRIIDVAADEPLAVQYAEEKPPAAKQRRNEAILALKDQGKTVANIARELGITQNEVKLVIGIAGRE